MHAVLKKTPNQLDAEGGRVALIYKNQNTVCQACVAKWRHTVERLKAVFENWN
ncbi:MAG: hypothetical protein RL297_1809 [Pseudomonadota bacterium]